MASNNVDRFFNMDVDGYGSWVASASQGKKHNVKCARNACKSTNSEYTPALAPHKLLQASLLMPQAADKLLRINAALCEVDYRQCLNAGR